MGKGQNSAVERAMALNSRPPLCLEQGQGRPAPWQLLHLPAALLLGSQKGAPGLDDSSHLKGLSDHLGSQMNASMEKRKGYRPAGSFANVVSSWHLKNSAKNPEALLPRHREAV